MTHVSRAISHGFCGSSHSIVARRKLHAQRSGAFTSTELFLRASTRAQAAASFPERRVSLCFQKIIQHDQETLLVLSPTRLLREVTYPCMQNSLPSLDSSNTSSWLRQQAVQASLGLAHSHIQQGDTTGALQVVEFAVHLSVVLMQTLSHE